VGIVEAAFAKALGLHVGDRLSLGGSSFEVAGTAVTAAIRVVVLVGGRMAEKLAGWA